MIYYSANFPFLIPSSFTLHLLISLSFYSFSSYFIFSFSFLPCFFSSLYSFKFRAWKGNRSNISSIALRYPFPWHPNKPAFKYTADSRLLRDCFIRPFQSWEESFLFRLQLVSDLFSFSSSFPNQTQTSVWFFEKLLHFARHAYGRGWLFRAITGGCSGAVLCSSFSHIHLTIFVCVLAVHCGILPQRAAPFCMQNAQHSCQVSVVLHAAPFCSRFSSHSRFTAGSQY
jgi:hypothetical protein